MGQLADWVCHKVVKAGKILEPPGHSRLIVVEDINGAPCEVVLPMDAFARGVPAIGDYIVIYEDGYKSWSPAKVFEDGYSRRVELER